jgi:site-specific recombinase XerC
MDPGAPNPLLRSFERHLRAENRSAQTVATYLIALRQAETFLATTRGTTLAAAGRADLEAYLGDLLTRRAAATAATYHKVLKLLYQWLEDEDELPASPMAKMRPPIIPDQPVPVIPDDRAPTSRQQPAGGKHQRGQHQHPTSVGYHHHELYQAARTTPGDNPGWVRVA